MDILMRGLDVSSHQKDIDWVKVKNAGYQFAMLKVAGRGYGSSGTLYKDQYFKKNFDGCKNNGLHMGFYFFSTAKNTTEVIEECNFIMSILNEVGASVKDFALPIVYDFEGYKNKEYRTFGISKTQRTLNCAKFKDEMSKYGFRVMLYGSQGNIKTTYDLDQLTDFIWCAKYAGGYVKIYDNDKYFPNIGSAYNPRIAMWQYTSIGKVAGINGNVDLDHMYINLLDESATSGNPYAEPTNKPQYKDGLLIPSNAVRWYQWELKEKGYYTDAIDGKFGQNTLKAEWKLIKEVLKKTPN